MEEKFIDEVFYVAGVKYKCIESEEHLCSGCVFDSNRGCELNNTPNDELFGECGHEARKDGKSVIFVLEE